MIRKLNANRDGQRYEDTISCAPISYLKNLSKRRLYQWLKDEYDINARDYLSTLLVPDEAYLMDDGSVQIFEKKNQGGIGSVDEKLQTGAYKLRQYKKLLRNVGITNVTYTYVLSEWFRHPRYKDVLEYISETPGVYYRFA